MKGFAGQKNIQEKPEMSDGDRAALIEAFRKLAQWRKEKKPIVRLVKGD